MSRRGEVLKKWRALLQSKVFLSKNGKVWTRENLKFIKRFLHFFCCWFFFFKIIFVLIKSYWSYVRNGCIKCDEGWIRWFDGCWQMFYEQATWLEARDFCRSFNSQLIVLDSEEKFVEFINIYSLYYKSTEGIWVNSAAETPLDFKWPTNQTVSLAFFGPNNPDNFGPNRESLNEGCLMLSSADQFRLNDARCNRKLSFICEYHYWRQIHNSIQ